MVTTESDGEIVMLALYGSLDLSAEACALKPIRRALTLGATHLVIDLSGVEFMDWIGLQVLLLARREALEADRQLTLLRGPDHIHRMLELTGAAQLFSFGD